MRDLLKLFFHDQNKFERSLMCMDTSMDEGHGLVNFRINLE